MMKQVPLRCASCGLEQSVQIGALVCKGCGQAPTLGDLMRSKAEMEDKVDYITERFQYYPPSTDLVADNHAYVRALLKTAARNLDAVLPDSREKSLVITKLEEAMFWANAAVARYQVDAEAEMEAKMDDIKAAAARHQSVHEAFDEVDAEAES